MRIGSVVGAMALFASLGGVQGGLQAQHAAGSAPAPTAASGEAGASHEMHALMQKGMNEMSAMKMSGDVDHDFATMMVMHHQMAVDMARIEARSGSDATIKAMARKIITSQEREIRDFKAWLAKHQAPRP